MSEQLVEKLSKLLSDALAKLSDFDSREKAELFSRETVKAVWASADGPDEFRDNCLAIIANAHDLDSVIQKKSITPAQLASMSEVEIASAIDDEKRAKESRKRARELINYDKTGLMCSKCGGVRQDRINPNQLALDSEEAGSHFDYDFDTICNCTHSSSDDDDDGDGAEGEASSSPSSSSSAVNDSRKRAKGETASDSHSHTTNS